MANKGIMAISDILNEYSQEIQEGMKEEAKRIAKEGQTTLKKTSPKDEKSPRKGRYAKGWRVQIEEGNGFVKCHIYNATDYQLTHLLEKPHATHNGGKYTPKQPHIEPVHDKCVTDYMEALERLIKNG